MVRRLSKCRTSCRRTWSFTVCASIFQFLQCDSFPEVPQATFCRLSELHRYLNKREDDVDAEHSHLAISHDPICDTGRTLFYPRISCSSKAVSAYPTCRAGRVSYPAVAELVVESCGGISHLQCQEDKILSKNLVFFESCGCACQLRRRVGLPISLM